jgi:hypothetical protein
MSKLVVIWAIFLIFFASHATAEMTRDETRAAAMLEMLQEQQIKQQRREIDREKSRIRDELEASKDVWDGVKTKDTKGSFAVSLFISGFFVGIASFFSWGGKKNKLTALIISSSAVLCFLVYYFSSRELQRYDPDWIALFLGFSIVPGISIRSTMRSEDYQLVARASGETRLQRPTAIHRPTAVPVGGGNLKCAGCGYSNPSFQSKCVMCQKALPAAN